MEYTIPEWQAELRRMFGSRPENYRFVCPHCGRVNRGKEFIDAGMKADDVAQACVGRIEGLGGCNWVAYGMFGTLGKGDTIIMLDGKRKAVFAMDRSGLTADTD